MPKKFFQRGKCVNCEAPINGGFLCASCTPPEPHKSPTSNAQRSKSIIPREIKISEMKEGDVGFTEQYAIFEANSKLFIIGSAKISLQSEGYKTARVELKRGIFEIDSKTIDRDDISLDWPELDDSIDPIDCFLAKLV